MNTLILASGSATRAKILTAAGVTFSTIAPQVDESMLRAQAKDGAAAARAIAEQKALAVSKAHLDAWVIGADQVLEVGTTLLGKPGTWAEARSQLTLLRGRTHRLVTAVAVAHTGAITWHHMESPSLTARTFTDEALDDYVRHAADAVLGSPGAYHFEGLGASLFDEVQGDYFSILGLPLLPLLAYLRTQAVISA